MKKTTSPLSLFSLFLSALSPNKALAADVFTYVPESLKGTQSTPENLIANVINIMLFVVGIVSVVVIIIAGIMYVASAGSPDRTKSAKDALLYAVIGLVISLSAFAIVNFVLGRF